MQTTAPSRTRAGPIWTTLSRKEIRRQEGGARDADREQAEADQGRLDQGGADDRRARRCGWCARPGRPDRGHGRPSAAPPPVRPAARPHAAERASSTPAMTIAARKPSMPKPAPATKDSSQTPNALSCGAICARACRDSPGASCQNWSSGWPMTGQSGERRLAARRIVKPPSDIRRAGDRRHVVDQGAADSMPSGTISTTSSRMVTTRVAARPPRSPSRCRSLVVAAV